MSEYHERYIELRTLMQQLMSTTKNKKLSRQQGVALLQHISDTNEEMQEAYAAWQAEAEQERIAAAKLRAAAPISPPRPSTAALVDQYIANGGPIHRPLKVGGQVIDRADMEAFIASL